MATCVVGRFGLDHSVLSKRVGLKGSIDRKKWAVEGRTRQFLKQH